MLSEVPEAEAPSMDYRQLIGFYAPLVMVCHHGNRSWHAAAMLLHSGFGAVHNLRGGVEEWAVEVEPAMKRD